MFIIKIISNLLFIIILGDSGGPLMFPIQDSEGEFNYFQIGIVSFGIGCARSEIPGVYTSVQKFADWIKETVDST
jgi:secreted trypsin-like serine protease